MAETELTAATEFERKLASLSLSLAEKDIWSPEGERDLAKIAQHCEWHGQLGAAFTYTHTVCFLCSELRQLAGVWRVLACPGVPC